MTRYRLKAWVPAQPSINQTLGYHSSCKLCAIAKIAGIAHRIANALHLDSHKVAWQVQVMDGHLSQWKTIATEHTAHHIKCPIHGR